VWDEAQLPRRESVGCDVEVRGSWWWLGGRVSKHRLAQLGAGALVLLIRAVGKTLCTHSADGVR
jgi:hypothetical protein